MTAPPPPPPPPKVRIDALTKYAQVESGGKVAKLLVDDRKLHAYLQLLPVAKAFEVKLKDLEEFLTEAHVLLAAERCAELERFVATLNDPAFDPTQLEQLDPVLVAQGVSPKDGADGYVDWNVDVPEPGKVRLHQDNRGNVNFREMHSVINVREGDLLCEVIEPRACEPGVDVFGNPIPGYDGVKARFQKGRSIKALPGGAQFAAEIAGHLRWDGATLSVEPIYEVPGDVDFKIGNIDFQGAVVVRNDVHDGFSIRAGQSISVGGVIGTANLHAVDNVEVKGGINGGADALVQTNKGTVFAKYLNNARVDSGGDVAIAERVTNAVINCKGRILVPQGQVVGGRLVALGGMDLGTVGVPAGTRTILELGLDYFENEELRRIEAELEARRAALEKIKPRLAPLLADPTRLKTLKPEQLEGVRKLSQELKRLEQEIAQLTAARETEQKQFVEAVGDEIVVRKEVQPGVEVTIDGCRSIFNVRISGPLVLRANYSDGTVSLNVARES